MLEVRMIVHGRVQGVGFRYSILNHLEANQSMVRGYVKNLPNGTVEIIGQGDIEELKDLRRFVLKGSGQSVVRDIEDSYQEIPEFTYKSFDIQY